jgi:hypothetical protein
MSVPGESWQSAIAGQADEKLPGLGHFSRADLFYRFLKRRLLSNVLLVSFNCSFFRQFPLGALPAAWGNEDEPNG